MGGGDTPTPQEEVVSLCALSREYGRIQA